ncbi:hypothetical protein Tco_0603806 [Tanacetum coccineum]
MARRPPNWKVVQDVNHKNLNDLDFVTLNIDGQSMNVDAPPDIIDVDEDEDFIDDEDVVPHDLADSDDEFLANDDDDDVAIVYSNVARGHGGDSGGDDRPPPRPICTGCRGEAENPTGEAGNEIIREFPIYYPCWHKIKPKKKAGVLGTLKQQFDLTPHIQSNLWPTIQKGIEQHLAKASDPGILRTSSKLIGISRLTIGLILRTLSEPFKMLKTGQRAKSSDDKDPDHLLSSEISRWRAPRLVSTRPSSRPTSTHILLTAYLCRTKREFNVGDADAQGSRRQYADGCALRRGLDNGHGSKGQAAGAHSRCWSDDRMSQLLMQLYSQHEVGGVAGVAGAWMMSRALMRMQAGMRTPTGMRRVRTCYIWILQVLLGSPLSRLYYVYSDFGRVYQMR